MLVAWRKSPSHAMLQELLFFGEMKNLERRPCTTTSAPSTLRDEIRAEIVSYDRNQSCLVSSLSFRATASRNGTTVTCTNRDRSSSQSLLLHAVSSECKLFSSCNVGMLYHYVWEQQLIRWLESHKDQIVHIHFSVLNTLIVSTNDSHITSLNYTLSLVSLSHETLL